MEKLIVVSEIIEDEGLLDVFSSSSEEDNGEMELLLALTSQAKKRRMAIRNYCEEVVENYTDAEFSTHFRITRQLYVQLVKEFATSKCCKNLIALPNTRSSISPQKHILVFLWFAGHQTASFRDVADRFDLCLSSLYDVITRVMEFLSSMTAKVIKFPTQTEKEITKRFYVTTKGFANLIGFIDGSHIKIDCPSQRPTDYFNHKDFYSIVLQAVCNEKLQLLDICVGYPGSVHDARVFRNSLLYTKLNELCGNGEYIYGDSAYPLLPNLITPYRDNGHLSQEQKYFNKTFSSCRVAIEHAFALLKQHFRQLYHLKLKGPVRICHFIRACCVLHNLSLGDNLNFEYEGAPTDQQPEDVLCRDAAQGEGTRIRNGLCRTLFENKSRHG